MDFGTDAEPTTWMVFVPCQPGEREPVVREATWRRTPDLERLYDLVRQRGRVVTFEPTIRVRDAAVPAGDLDALLREAASFQVPLVWLDSEMAVTTDVGAVGFDFFSLDGPPAVLRVQWSCDRPPEWEPVVAWADRLRGLLQGCLAGSPSAGAGPEAHGP
jgi:hypothetical protein